MVSLRAVLANSFSYSLVGKSCCRHRKALGKVMRSYREKRDILIRSFNQKLTLNFSLFQTNSGKIMPCLIIKSRYMSPLHKTEIWLNAVQGGQSCIFQLYKTGSLGLGLADPRPL